MDDINKFGEDIQKFRNGVLDYIYSFNSAGNLFFKSNSSQLNQQFLKVNVKSLEYDNKKLLKLFPTEFEEFVINNQATTSQTTSDIQDEKIVNLENQVVDLQNQLEVANQSLDEKDVNDAQKMAIKDVIIQLRISNGEGTDPSEFNDEFPYTLKSQQ